MAYFLCSNLLITVISGIATSIVWDIFCLLCDHHSHKENKMNRCTATNRDESEDGSVTSAPSSRAPPSSNAEEVTAEFTTTLMLQAARRLGLPSNVVVPQSKPSSSEHRQSKQQGKYSPVAMNSGAGASIVVGHIVELYHSISIKSKALGPKHLSVLSARIKLSRLLLDNAQPHEAESQFLQVIRAVCDVNDDAPYNSLIDAAAAHGRQLKHEAVTEKNFEVLSLLMDAVSSLGKLKFDLGNAEDSECLFLLCAELARPSTRGLLGKTPPLSTRHIDGASGTDESEAAAKAFETLTIFRNALSSSPTAVAEFLTEKVARNILNSSRAAAELTSSFVQTEDKPDTPPRGIRVEFSELQDTPSATLQEQQSVSSDLRSLLDYLSNPHHSSAAVSLQQTMDKIRSDR